MPHLFVNRPRLHNLFAKDPSLRDQFRWETINAIVYKLGGLVFVGGSILFFPSMAAYADLGAWTFILGSFLYLLVTGHDMAEALYSAHIRAGRPSIWDRLELGAAGSYLLGTILFTVGSVFFLSAVGLVSAGASCFVAGSLLFVLGATINVLQIVQAGTIVMLQLMNLTALAFVTGSLLFTVASIPYLWHFRSAADRETLDAFLAAQYLSGSLLFLLGGVFNYWRSYVVIREYMRAEDRAGAGLSAHS